MNEKACLSIPKRKSCDDGLGDALSRSKNCLMMSMSNQANTDLEIEVAEMLYWEHTLDWLLANYNMKGNSATRKPIVNGDDFITNMPIDKTALRSNEMHAWE